MTYAERSHRWNQWYDGLPERWRFQVLLWPLLLIGTLNMMLTIASGFPFGLLLILAIMFLAFVRIPYKTRLLAEPSEASPERTVRLGRIDWMWELNTRYDAMPEWRRFWVVPTILLVAGALNMALTLGGGFPFGLLFLLALLVVVGLRAPYVWGWLTPVPDERLLGTDVPSIASAPPSAMSPAHPTAMFEHEEPARPSTETRDPTPQN